MKYAASLAVALAALFGIICGMYWIDEVAPDWVREVLAITLILAVFVAPAWVLAHLILFNRKKKGSTGNGDEK